MEHLVLKVLSFDVAVPTFNCFCEKFLKDMDADDKTSSLAMVLMLVSHWDKIMVDITRTIFGKGLDHVDGSNHALKKKLGNKSDKNKHSTIYGPFNAGWSLTR